MTCICGGVLTWNDDYTALECSWCQTPQRISNDHHYAGEPPTKEAPARRRETIPRWPLVPVGAYRVDRPGVVR